MIFRATEKYYNGILTTKSDISVPDMILFEDKGMIISLNIVTGEIPGGI